MKVMLKRAYETPAASDGYRVLVDRLWPRGLAKVKARIDLWLKEVAPSTELRQWFGQFRLPCLGRRNIIQKTKLFL